MKVEELIPNKKNPRTISAKAFRGLVKNIERDPDFLKYRPIFINKDNVIRAGNQRYQAILKLGWKEIPDEYIAKNTDWDEKKIQRFEILDNVSAGKFDVEMLAAEYEADIVELTGMVIQKGDFTREFSKYDDNNADYPLMPMYDEKYDAVVIITETQTELAKLKTTLGITGKRQSYKNSFIGETNCVYFKETKLSK